MEGKKQRSALYTAKGVVDYSPDLKDMPKPGNGEVLIKVEAAPINPSDLYMMQGNYSGTFEYPVIPGAEGSGTVISSGGGMMGWSMIGKRVGFTRAQEKGGKFSRGGSYAEYCVTNAYQCITLNNDATWEQGACSFVNPVTAIGLLDRAKAHGAKAVIQTGAASQLGRMIILLMKENKIPMINVVRREEQIELLKKEHGAEYVLNSTDPNFDKDLYDLARKLKANVGLECVAGETTGRVLQCLGPGGTMIVYGQLSEQKIGPINPIVFLFHAQKIEPFLLPYWLQTKNLIGQWKALNASKRLVTGIQVGKCFGLHQINEAIEYYKNNMTAGKVFLKPSLTE